MGFVPLSVGMNPAKTLLANGFELEVAAIGGDSFEVVLLDLVREVANVRVLSSAQFAKSLLEKVLEKAVGSPIGL
jgi:hypothetical protein